jgi:hypothetical protein
MNTTKENTKMQTYHILYNTQKPGVDALFDRRITIPADSPQDAVNKLYQTCEVFEVEAVQTYKQDEHGGYYEDCDWS